MFKNDTRIFLKENLSVEIHIRFYKKILILETVFFALTNDIYYHLFIWRKISFVLPAPAICQRHLG